MELQPRFTKSQLEEIRSQIADVEGIDAKSLSDQQLEALAFAYLMHESKERGSDDSAEVDDDGQEDGEARAKQDSDVDDLDFDNFKGIYFNDDPNRKY